MSGPKVIEIDYEALARAREENRGKWKSLLAHYSVEIESLASLNEQIKLFAVDIGVHPISTEALQKKTEIFFTEGDGIEAVIELKKSLHKAQMYLAEAQSRIKSRVFELQRRHRGLEGRLKKLKLEMDGLARQYGSLLPGISLDNVRERIFPEIQADLEGLKIPSRQDLILNEKGINAIEHTEAKLSNICRQFELIREQRLGELKVGSPLHGEPLGKLTHDFPDPETRMEDQNLVEKLDNLLAELVVLKDYPYWEMLSGKAELVRTEKSSTQRTLLYEDLLIECSRKINLAKQHDVWRKQLSQLYAEAKLLKSVRGKEFVKELEAFERRRDISIDLNAARDRMCAIQGDEAISREKEKRINAVLDSLKQQGYQISHELMDVATVKDGKLVFEKPIALNLPGEEDYAVWVSVSGENAVQTEMVRYEDAEESLNQNIMDKEKEETWCSHHAQLMKDLDALGYSINLKLSKNAGELPVRVVSREDSKFVRERTKGVSLKGKYLE